MRETCLVSSVYSGETASAMRPSWERDGGLPLLWVGMNNQSCASRPGLGVLSPDPGVVRPYSICHRLITSVIADGEHLSGVLD